jgi:hypothetical protein
MTDAGDARMQARPRPFWVAWLLVVTGMGALLGLAFVVLPGPMQDAFNLLIFGDRATPEGFSDRAVDYLEFAYAVLGAVMVGWMVLLAIVIHGPLRAGDRWAWTAVLASAGTWFVIDTTASIASGYPENAALNAVFGAGFAIGLWATRPTAR